jgi:hypothetical protein
MLVHCYGGLAQVTFTDEVVAVKDCSRFVPTDLHGHSLRYPGPHHIQHGGSPKVMK